MASIHEDIVRFIAQQKSMYGNTAYVAHSDSPRTIPADQPPQAEIQETPAESMTEAHNPPADDASWEASSSLDVLNSRICECLNCPLGSTRTKFVFGSGNPNADLMVVGEAPGADEDKQGLPFVGRAGQLLTKILEAIELPRDEVYICNILKCRPPNNRKPLQAETDACEPYLWKQIELIKPKMILALGLTAATTLLKTKQPMRELRGDTHDYHGIPMVVTYHPAALLRNPEWKKSTWEDVQRLKSMLDTAA